VSRQTLGSNSEASLILTLYVLTPPPHTHSLPAPVAASGSSTTAVAEAGSTPPTLSSLYVPATGAEQATTSPSWLPPSPPGKKYQFKKNVNGLGTIEKGAHYDMTVWN
jgi:hypothetical protein